MGKEEALQILADNRVEIDPSDSSTPMEVVQRLAMNGSIDLPEELKPQYAIVSTYDLEPGEAERIIEEGGVIVGWGVQKSV